MKIEINNRGETVIQGDVLVFVDGEVKGCVVALDTQEGWVEQRLLASSERIGNEQHTHYKTVRHCGKVEIKDPPALPSAPTVSPA